MAGSNLDMDIVADAIFVPICNVNNYNQAKKIGNAGQVLMQMKSRHFKAALQRSVARIDDQTHPTYTHFHEIIRKVIDCY